jgi:hypothetical protein
VLLPVDVDGDIAGDPLVGEGLVVWRRGAMGVEAPQRGVWGVARGLPPKTSEESCLHVVDIVMGDDDEEAL